MKKLALEPQDILNKKFTVNLKGYDAEEVDKMLDVMLDDYYTMQDIHKAHLNKAEQLELEIANLKSRLQDEVLRNEMLINSQKKLEERGVANIDLLQRLSRLEDVIHLQNKEDENK